MFKVILSNKSFWNIYKFIKKNFTGKTVKNIFHTEKCIFIFLNDKNIFLSFANDATFIGITKNFEGKKIPIGKTYLNDIKLLQNDRIICFNLGKKRLIAELITGKSNFFITENNRIIWLLKPISNTYRTLTKGSEYIPPPPPPEDKFIEDYKELSGIKINQLNNRIAIEISDTTDNMEDILINISEKIYNELKREQLNSAISKEKKRLKRELKKHKKLLEKLEEEIQEFENYDRYIKIGELLKSNIHLINKGMNKIKLKDWESDKLIDIELDPSLSPIENMEYYFKRGKKAKNAIIKLKDRIYQEKKTIQNLIQKIENISEKDIIDTKNKHSSNKDSQNPGIPGIKYLTTNGFTVSAGRNKKENETLTFHFAKTDDIFFHCRETAGAHTILFIHTAKGSPTPQDIEDAATVAAYHSKSRHSTVVPVTYTKRKYVQKIKGITGMVKLQRENVIMVYNPEESIKKLKRYDNKR